MTLDLVAVRLKSALMSLATLPFADLESTLYLFYNLPPNIKVCSVAFLCCGCGCFSCCCAVLLAVSASLE